MADGQFIIALLALIATVVIAMIVGFWTIMQAIAKKFEKVDLTRQSDIKSLELIREEDLKTIFRRIDENKTSYWKSFVAKEVYEETMKLRDKSVDERMLAVVALFNEKLDGLRNEIRILTSRTKDHGQ